MTRKDYVLLAAAIKASTVAMNQHEKDKAHDAYMAGGSGFGTGGLSPTQASDIIIKNITKVLKDDNSMFDAARFTTACKA